MTERIARLVLVALVATSAVSTDLYLSGIPQLARELGVGAAEGQLTISLFMIGFGCGQLLFGPLSDYYGRKPVVTVGMWLYAATSLACALAPTIGALYGARFCQGLAASAGPVIARAIVRDRYQGAEAARVMGLLAAAMSLMPLVAPVLGSWLLYLFDWRAQFGLLMLFGLAIVAGLGQLAESCPGIRQAPLDLVRVLRSFGLCLRNRRFTGYLLCGAASHAAMFAWISSASWIVIDRLGVAPQDFGYTFMGVVTGYMAGALLGARLVGRIGSWHTLALGVIAALIGALAMLACAGLDQAPLAAVLLAAFGVFLGSGLCLSTAQMGAISEYPHRAGAASAVFGFLQTSAAALTGLLVGQLYDDSLRPTAFTLLGTVVLAVAGLLLLHFTRDAPPEADHVTP